MPPSLAPALLDKAYRESRAGDGGTGGFRPGGRRSSVRVSGGEAGDDRFAERFDEASVLFAEGETIGFFSPR